jgi:uncharacterized circularly permuted ATP-grasp superfamily protein
VERHHYDEMREPNGEVRPHFQPLADWLAETPAARVAEKRREADLLFHRVGITFAVYGDKQGDERLIPFDIVPRVIPKSEWELLERGLKQRVAALNRFLHDIYHDQEILKAGKISAEQVTMHDAYQPVMRGLDLPNGVYSHIAGIDLVRHEDGLWYVLEDNLRTPSGVSYMLENRKMMLRLFPELFARQPVQPVEQYPALLLETLRASAPPRLRRDPSVVVLTPGQHNSAYFEHAFLAQQMGVELVEGADLFVKDEYVYMRATTGAQRVDVIYRRIDDASSIRRRSGRFGARGAGPGRGVSRRQRLARQCDRHRGRGRQVDLSVRSRDDPLLSRRGAAALQRPDLAMPRRRGPEVRARPSRPAGREGGAGLGRLRHAGRPGVDQAQIKAFRERLRANAGNYIAQPTLSLSTCPTFVKRGIAPRHVDLRPFVLSGKEVRLVPGGLTRVALKAGSLVVNSSQGGGTKDTWVVD